jgi:phosphatidate cytidylyltransferase
MRDLPRRTVSAIVYAAFVLVAVFSPDPVFALALVTVGVLAFGELFALRRAGPVVVLELFLVAAGLASLYFLRLLNPFPYAVLLMTIVAVWAADVVAYAVGSTLGRRKIVPRISPGKTWEGTVAGFVAAALVVALANAPLVGLYVWWVVTAILIGPVAFAGDLVESWMKRRAGVKDSGTLLPGHGGVLDRIDSLVAAAPLVTMAIVLLGRVG